MISWKRIHSQTRMNQRAYIKKTLAEFDMTNCKHRIISSKEK